MCASGLLAEQKIFPESETGKDIPVQDDNPSTGCEGSLSPGKELFLSPFLVTQAAERLRGGERLSQQYGFSLSTLAI